MPKLSPQEELEELHEIQERIDAVAKDLSSGRNRYAKIETSELGKLLGVDVGDTLDWEKSDFVYLCDVEDQGFEFPFAENIQLLKSEISADRYQILKERAEQCIVEAEDDIQISTKERALINAQYTRRISGRKSELEIASNSLEASNGDILTFEVEIGNSCDVFGVYSPYDIKNGHGFNYTNYVEVFDPY